MDDIDISVHCDIKIFEWLMVYLKRKHGPKVISGNAKEHEPPKLDIKNVISILISSDFLGMAALVDECVDYVKLRLSDVVKLPIDMNCLN